jgi:hypothetical protein
LTQRTDVSTDASQIVTPNVSNLEGRLANRISAISLEESQARGLASFPGGRLLKADSGHPALSGPVAQLNQPFSNFVVPNRPLETPPYCQETPVVLAIQIQWAERP